MSGQNQQHLIEGQTMLRAGLALIFLGGICSLLRLARWVARRIHKGLPYPPNAEQMGEGLARETIVYALLGDLECLLADYLDPAIELLRRAGTTSPPPEAS